MIKKLINKQFIVYLLVGGFTTGLDLFLYWLFVDIINIWYILAAATISPFTLFLNYLLHRKKTFKSTEAKIIQIPKYLSLVLTNYFAGLSVLYMFVDIVGLHYFIGRLATMGVIMVWNYTALRLFVFK